MKYLLWFFSIIVTLFVITYVTLFTPIGNNIVRPIIESKVNEKTKLNAKLTTFVLTTNYIELTLLLDDKNSLHVKGEYSLVSLSFELAYDVKLQELQKLSALTKEKLYGSLLTQGTLKGTKVQMHIVGKSDVFKSVTSYNVELTELNPTSIIAKVKGARVEEILKMLGKKPYAKAAMNADIDFKDIRPHHLNGDLLLHVSDSVIDYAMLKREFGVDIPHTEFTMDAKARLKGDDAVYKASFDSNLAKITSEGLVTPAPLALNLNYNVDVKELALLRPLLKAPLRGALKVQGSVKGGKENLHVNAKSDVAGSVTTVDAQLKDFKPKELSADIKHLYLQRLFFMLNQPHYADGVANIKAKIESFEPLSGRVDTDIKSGVLDSRYVSKTYGIKNLPYITFNAKTATTLSFNEALTAADVKTNLADLHVNKALYKMTDSSLDSDYALHIADLVKLHFITERNLKGSLDLNGKLNVSKQQTSVTAHSSIFEGKVDAKLLNKNLTASFDGLRTLPLLKMLEYPQIFDAKVGGTMTYDLADKKGKLNAKLREGQFTKNQMIALVKQYAQTDLYKERFSGDVKADILKEKIDADLHLKSNNAKIDTKELKLDTDKKLINATIRVEANKNPLTVSLNGAINKPRIGIDATELLKQEAGKKINKEINKFLKGLF